VTVRKSSMEKMREAKSGRAKPLEMDLDGLLKLLVDPMHGPTRRMMNPTQEAFIKDGSRIKAYMGPAGCAKTSTLCAGGFIRALLQPGSKGLVARANYNKLKDTTGLRMEEMLKALPPGVLLDRDKTPPMKWWINPIPFTAPDGTVFDEPSQITFMGLTDGLGSYEFDWAILDEVDEMDERTVHEVSTRLRNRPPMFEHIGVDVPYSLAMAFNPPDKHHWLYSACTGKDFQEKTLEKGPWIRWFRPQAQENLRNLDKNYYVDMAKNLTEDMKQRLVDGDWGSTFQGQPVYREFKHGLHVRDNLNYDAHSPLLRFWDFGYQRPACIWAQIDGYGRLLILREFLGQNIEAKPFIERCKAITATHFPGAGNFVDYGDPAVTQKKDTGQTLHEFLTAGIQMMYQTSSIERGVSIIRNKLELLIDGEPAFQFSRSGAPILIAALRGGYRLDDKGLKPLKDGYYDHLADAFRYGCFNLFNGSTPIASYRRDSVSNWLPESIAYDANFDN
jgi:hypothetical protein